MVKSRAVRMSCLALAVAAEITWVAPSRGGENSVKIGVIADMNGPLSTASGPGSLEAARMAAEEFNCQ